MNRILIAAAVLAAFASVPAATANKPPDKPAKKQPGKPVDTPGKQAGAGAPPRGPKPG